MKITYTDSRDGMVLIGFTDERGEHEIALSTNGRPYRRVEDLARGGGWKSGRKQHGPFRTVGQRAAPRYWKGRHIEPRLAIVAPKAIKMS